MHDPITNELLFEIMKAVQVDVAVMLREGGELKAGMVTLSARVTAALALVHTDLDLLSERLDRVETRMDSIEGRLERIETQTMPH